MVKRFLVVGTFRTGSSALAEQLGLHSAIACGWESSGDHYWRQRAAVTARVLSGDFSDLGLAERSFLEKNFTSETEWLGFRLLFRAHYRWLFNPARSLVSRLDGLDACLAWLDKNPDVHIIHLVRRDNLQWLRSMELARVTGQYVGGSYPESLTVSVEPGRAVRRVRMKHCLGARLGRLAGQNPYCRVRYEDFCDDPCGRVIALWDFLGVRGGLATSSAPTIQIQRKAGNVLSNEAELREKLVSDGLLFDET